MYSPLQGIVIAEEYEDKVMEEMEKDEAERKRKEDEKRRKAALGMWRKLLMGMRIAARIKEEYGHLEDKEAVDLGTNGDLDGEEEEGGFERMTAKDEDMAGGFLPEGYEGEDPVDQPRHTSSYFPVAHEDDVDDPLEIAYGAPETETASPKEEIEDPGHNIDNNEDEGDEEGEEDVKPAAKRRQKAVKPATKPKPKLKTRASTRRRNTRAKLESSEEDGIDDDDDEDFEL